MITNTLGLHARAAAQLVRLASGYRCSVRLKRDDTGVTANAKSILSVLYIAAGLGVKLRIATDGESEQDAMDAIVKLFIDKFGED